MNGRSSDMVFKIIEKRLIWLRENKLKISDAGTVRTIRSNLSGYKKFAYQLLMPVRWKNRPAVMEGFRKLIREGVYREDLYFDLE